MSLPVGVRLPDGTVILLRTPNMAGGATATPVPQHQGELPAEAPAEAPVCDDTRGDQDLAPADVSPASN
jgi:hypothetical protein